MDRKTRKSWKRWLLVPAAVLVVAGGVGLLKLRKEADGLRNAFSPSYWKERKAGEDLYNASEHYFKRGSRESKTVCLTIDDGPHPESITSILDTLKEQHVPAAFFVVGTRVKRAPELVQRMIDEGHEVGNHTQDHKRLDTLTPEQIGKELDFCETNIEKACGRKATLFRPPGMRFSEAVMDAISTRGFTMVGYNVGAKDFSQTPGNGAVTGNLLATLSSSGSEVVERVMKQVKNGSIILLHDEPNTAAALPQIIARLRAEGYEFKSVSDMMASIPQSLHVVANPPHQRPIRVTSIGQVAKDVAAMTW